MGEKQCRECNQVKPVSEFYLQKPGKPRAYCKPCNTLRSKRWRANNRDRAREIARDSARKTRKKIKLDPARQEKAKAATFALSLQRLYSLTIDEYEQMVERQGSCCAICGETETGRRLAVDHDHACCAETPACGSCNRALLCNNCNLVLGNARDSARILKSAQAYLERWGALDA